MCYSSDFTCKLGCAFFYYWFPWTVDDFWFCMEKVDFPSHFYSLMQQRLNWSQENKSQWMTPSVVAQVWKWKNCLRCITLNLYKKMCIIHLDYTAYSNFVTSLLSHVLSTLHHSYRCKKFQCSAYICLASKQSWIDVHSTVCSFEKPSPANQTGNCDVKLRKSWQMIFLETSLQISPYVWIGYPMVRSFFLINIGRVYKMSKF